MGSETTVRIMIEAQSADEAKRLAEASFEGSRVLDVKPAVPGVPIGKLVQNRVTGNWCYVVPRLRLRVALDLRHPVPGLNAFEAGPFIRFEYTSDLPLDRSDAVDAQCRAGWDDNGYGLYDFHAERDAATGKWVASWECSKSCE